MPQFVTSTFIWIVVIAVVVLLFVVPNALRIIKEWERGVLLRLGRFHSVKQPGVRFIWPVIDRLITLDLRIVTMDVAKQEMMTVDNVPVTVDAVIYFQVVNAPDAVIKVENYVKATSLIAQTTLRSVVGQSELDELLAQRDKLNQQLQTIIDEQTEPWGIKVTAVEIRDVILPEGMKRAMARQAEVERERRAKVINAEGEFQAAQRLADAAAIISQNPQALQLRYLQTLAEVATEHNSTTLFPIPIDLFTPFIQRMRQESGDGPPK